MYLVRGSQEEFMKSIRRRFKIASEWPGKVYPRVKSLLVTTKKESRLCKLTLGC